MHSATATIDGHVAIVAFANPAHPHATRAMIEAIGAAFDAADADPAGRAILLRSGGGCSA